MTRRCIDCRFFNKYLEPMCCRPIENNRYMVSGSKTIPLWRSAYTERKSTADDACGLDAKFFEPLPSLVEWIRAKLTSSAK